MKRILISIGAVAVTGLIAYSLLRSTGSDNEYVVELKPFIAKVSCKGEIYGAKGTEMRLPKVMLNEDFHRWHFKIDKLVPEGTFVRTGDFVAQFATNDLNDCLQNTSKELARYRSDLSNARLDSTIQLSKWREDIKNGYFDIEYKKIELEEAKFESPAYQRKAQIAFNKSKRLFIKVKRDYGLMSNQLKIKVQRLEERVDRNDRLVKKLEAAIKACSVKSKHEGIVIYARTWGERKVKEGDYIGRYRPTFVLLPDLSVVNSEMLVKEIDVTKIHHGDSVNIKVDALSDRVYKGVVYSIANIGQEQDATGEKLFKVVVRMNQSDELLKPNMTTTNEIIFSHEESVLVVPHEAVFQNANEQFVYIKKAGDIEKKLIETGTENEKMMKIVKGLNVGDRVLLYQPENHAEISFVNKSKS